MIALTLARKPLAGRTVARAATEFGTGALNIDDCRIASGTEHFQTDRTRRQIVAGDTRTGAALGMFAPGATFTPANHPGGRWPANLLLSHKEGCRVVGEREEPGYTINRWTDGAKPFGGGAGHPYAGTPVAGGPVSVWACEPGCPSGELDRQGEAVGCHSAGSTKPPSDGKPYKATSYMISGPSAARIGDKGGISRFFRRFGAG